MSYTKTISNLLVSTRVFTRLVASVTSVPDNVLMCEIAIKFRQVMQTAVSVVLYK